MSVFIFNVVTCFLFVLVLMPSNSVSASGTQPRNIMMTRGVRENIVRSLAVSLGAQLEGQVRSDEAICEALLAIQNAAETGSITLADKKRLLNEPRVPGIYPPLVMLLGKKLPLTMRLSRGDTSLDDTMPIVRFIMMGGHIWNCAGKTAFQIALEAGNLTAACFILEVMIERDANAVRCYVDGEGKSFLHYIACANQVFQENIPERFIPIQTAFRHMIMLLVGAGVDINAVDKKGKPPLYYAIGKYHIARLLLEHGAHSNIFYQDFKMSLYERFVFLYHKDKPSDSADMSLAAQSFVRGELARRDIKKLSHYFSEGCELFHDRVPTKKLFIELSKEFASAWERKDIKLVTCILDLDDAYVYELFMQLIPALNLQLNLLCDAAEWGNTKMIEALIIKLEHFSKMRDLAWQFKVSVCEFAQAVGHALQSNNEFALRAMSKLMPSNFDIVISKSIINYLSCEPFMPVYQQHIYQLIKYFKPTFNYKDDDGNTILHHAYARKNFKIVAAIRAFCSVDDVPLLNSAGDTPTECTLTPRFLDQPFRS